ncbi:MAG: DUF481 domain-containing protein [Tepidisphaeraceae bacterium]
MKSFVRSSFTAAAVALAASAALADTVVLTDGNTLTGKIGEVSASSLKFSSDSLGEITVPLAKVTSYKFDAPTVVSLKEKEPIQAAVSGDAKTVKADETSYTFDQVKSVNPPAVAWKGAVLANFALARGNTNKFTVGVDANAALRRDDYQNDDRTTLIGQYNFGTSGQGEESTTDTDNFTLSGKYDRFWTDKLYGFVSNKLEHDRIADLYFRDTPSVGLGYQWVESPQTNFNTEAGLGYVFERYDDGDSNQYPTVRLAYHIDHQLNDKVSVFHNLEFLPGITDPSDYNLNTDAGVKVTFVANFVGQFKVEYKRDNTPAEGRAEERSALPHRRRLAVLSFSSLPRALTGREITPAFRLFSF